MSTTRDLPNWLCDLVNSPPRAGEGVHNWLFRIARQLHAHMPDPDIVRTLEVSVANCGRHVSRQEIVDAVANSAGCAWQPSQSTSVGITKPRRPEPDLNRIERLVKSGPGLADLWEVSPVRIEDNASHAEQIIDALFPGNPLLCCGASMADFDTKPREQWRGQLEWLSLIVPSPMTAPTGITQAGKVSEHSLNNTGPRRFLVVECDFSIYARDGKIETKYAPLIRELAKTGVQVADMCAAVLLHLAQYAPMVAVVHSGGKSLHGWFYVGGEAEAKVERFFNYAIRLGADPATWTRSQFVRLPDGMRDNGKRQTVFFLNLNPLKGRP